jgi:hypothetical protein
VSVQDVRLGSVAEGLSWLRAAVKAVTSTPEGSPERQARLAELARAVARARETVSARGGRFRSELLVALAAADVLLRRLAGPASTPPAPKPARVNPRWLLQR